MEKEYLCLYFKITEIEADTLKNITKYLNKIFPNKEIILLPTTTSLEKQTKDDLKWLVNYYETAVKYLKEVIENE